MKRFRTYHFILSALAALLIGIFLVVSSEVHEAAMGEPELIADLDTFLLKFAEGLRRPWLNGVAVDFTALGSTTVLTLLTLLFAIFMLMRNRRDLVIHIIVSSSGAGLLSKFLKTFFGRERPTLIEKLVTVQGHSYPSGHSLASAAIYLTLALLICKLPLRNTQRGVVLLLAGIVVSLIGISRIYLGVHYPSDVLAGLLLGTSWALLLAAIAHYITNASQPSGQHDPLMQ